MNGTTNINALEQIKLTMSLLTNLRMTLMIVFTRVAVILIMDIIVSTNIISLDLHVCILVFKTLVRFTNVLLEEQKEIWIILLPNFCIEQLKI